MSRRRVTNFPNCELVLVMFTGLKLNLCVSKIVVYQRAESPGSVQPGSSFSLAR